MHLLAGLAAWLTELEPSLSQSVVIDVEATASGMGQPFEILTATTHRDLRPAFDAAVRKRVDALLITADPLFANRAVQSAILAARHAMPAILRCANLQRPVG